MHYLTFQEYILTMIKTLEDQKIFLICSVIVYMGALESMFLTS